MSDTETVDALQRLEATAHVALPRFGIAATAPLALIHHRENAVFRVVDPADGGPAGECSRSHPPESNRRPADYEARARRN